MPAFPTWAQKPALHGIGRGISPKETASGSLPMVLPAPWLNSICRPIPARTCTLSGWARWAGGILGGNPGPTKARGIRLHYCFGGTQQSQRRGGSCPRSRSTLFITSVGIQSARPRCCGRAGKPFVMGTYRWRTGHALALSDHRWPCGWTGAASEPAHWHHAVDAESAAYGGARRFAAGSKQRKRPVLRRAGAGHVELLPDIGVPATLLQRPPLERAASPKLIVLWAGRLVRWKGLTIVLRVAKAVRTQDVRFLIAGWGRDQWVEREVRRLGLGDRVVFLGHLSWHDFAAALRRSRSIHVHQPRDTFGTVNFEALAKGCPVMCLNHHGVGSDLPDAVAISTSDNAASGCRSDGRPH